MQWNIPYLNLGVGYIFYYLHYILKLIISNIHTRLLKLMLYSIYILVMIILDIDPLTN